MKKIVSLVLIFMFVLSLSVLAFADNATTSATSATTSVSNASSNAGTVSTQAVLPSNSIATSKDEADAKALHDIQTGGLPNVTMDQASSWVEKKGFDIVKFLQTVVQPFAIIIFILSAMLALVGAFGNSQLVSRGLWGMFLSVIIYAVVLYSPEIMDFMLGWLKS